VITKSSLISPRSRQGHPLARSIGVAELDGEVDHARSNGD